MHHKGSNLKLVTWPETPVSTLYRSEVDVSPELNVANAAHYQSLIGGILHCMAELGRLNICMEVSMMSPWWFWIYCHEVLLSIFLDNDRNYERWEYHVNCQHTFWTNLSCTIFQFRSLLWRRSHKVLLIISCIRDLPVTSGELHKWRTLIRIPLTC